VVTKKGGDGKSRRHDVVMDEKRRMKLEGREREKHVLEIAQKKGATWLMQRAKRCGFSASESVIHVEAYQQHKSPKRSRSIAYSTIDFSGVLTVDNPERFIESLKAGIGPAKAFGCGLMLVRRV